MNSKGVEITLWLAAGAVLAIWFLRRRLRKVVFR
jgi:MYXO-CTERM domain-containing protein